MYFATVIKKLMSLFSAILVLHNLQAKSYIEGKACPLLNEVMKGKNKRKMNNNQLPVLQWSTGTMMTQVMT